MPELPDVEVFKRYIDATSLHKTVRRVTAPAPKILADLSVSQLSRALCGQRIEASRRWGKQLFLELDSGRWLALHFGMTSYPRYQRAETLDDTPDARFDAVRLFFDNDYLMAFNSRRKLGRIRLVDDPEAFARDQQLGPDALAIGEDDFVQRLERGRGGLKSFLMNQKQLSGLGNETSDEILFQAGWHPARQVRSLSGSERRRLYRLMVEVLEADIDAGADQDRMPDGFLLPRRREGERCPRCGGDIRNVKAAGRSAYICPRCQPEP